MFTATATEYVEKAFASSSKNPVEKKKEQNETKTIAKGYVLKKQMQQRRFLKNKKYFLLEKPYHN